MWHKLVMQAAATYLRRQTRRRPVRPLEELDPGPERRVLLLNFTALGDLLFSTPAIRALGERFPHWRLDLLAHRRHQGLMEPHPRLSRVWYYPGRGWGLLPLLGQLRRQAYDLAIILHGNDPEASLLARGSGAPFVIGSARSPLAFCYSAQVARTDPYGHAIERRLNFVRLLGADTADTRMDLYPAAGEEERARELLNRHFGGEPHLVVALHPVGSAPYKCWPLESYAALGTRLHQAYGASFLVISGGRDRPQAEALATRIGAPTLVTGGGYSLPAVVALLGRCRLLVGNDSGPFHLAMALGVPGIALMGADHPRRVGPYRVEWGTYLYKKDGVCPQEPCLNKECPDNRCLKAIEVGEVVRLIEKWWEPRYLPGPEAAPRPPGG